MSVPANSTPGPAAVSGRSELARLEQERQDALVKLDHLRIEMRSLAEPSADEADVDAFEREKTLALIQGLQRKVESIDRAIQAAHSGTYGICESCGIRIDPARLDILPQATLCFNCQKQVERRSRRRRP